MPTDTANHFRSVKDLPAGSHNRARVHALAFWVSCLVRVFGFGSLASLNRHGQTGSLVQKISRISRIP